MQTNYHYEFLTNKGHLQEKKKNFGGSAFPWWRV